MESELKSLEKNVIQNPVFKDKVVPVCIAIITVLMVTAAFHIMRPILVPLVFSVFLYIVMAPFIDWCQQRLYLPKFISVLLSFVLLIMAITACIAMMGISVKAFIKGSSLYQLKLLNLVDDFTMFLNSHGIKIDLSLIRQTLLDLPFLQWVSTFSGGIFGFVGNSTLVLIFTMFLLMGTAEKDAKGIANKTLNQRISRYLLTKLFTSSLTAVLVGLTFTMFNVQLALMFAILTFLLNFIPSIGSIVAILIPIPVIFLQFGYSMNSLLCIVIPTIIQFGIGNILDPKLMGESLGMHPAIVLASLLFWGFVWGVPGMFLAVPMTSVVKLLLNLSERTKPIAAILEGKFK